MNFLRLNLAKRSIIPRSYKAIFYSADAVIPSRASGDYTLCQRIIRDGDRGDSSVVRSLRKWQEDGKPITVSELKLIIMRLRKAKRWKHALQVVSLIPI